MIRPSTEAVVADVAVQQFGALQGVDLLVGGIEY